MGIKRLLLKKGIIGGGLIQGHIVDALQKKEETGKSFKDCLMQSVKETFTEDLPGTRHIYDNGREVGRSQGAVEQAKRDERIIKQMHEKHENESKHWQEIDHKKDELLDEKEKNLRNKDIVKKNVENKGIVK